MAAVLEAEHEVHIIDAANEGWRTLRDVDGTKYRQGLKNEEIEGRLKRFSPDIVQITIPFSGWCRPAYEMAAIAKGMNENTITVLSGLHPSARPNDCLEHPNVDYVIIGESELTAQELVNTLGQGKEGDLKKVMGIGYMKDGEAIITAPRPVIQDLDSLPFPARAPTAHGSLFRSRKREPAPR